MKRIKTLIAVFAVAVLGVFALTPVATVGALDPLAGVCGSSTAPSQVCDNKDDDAGKIINSVINILLFIVGTIAVIMIIVAGIFYVTSAGDAGKVTKAKNTLTYSIVGLLVALLAYAIVNWVVKILPN